MVMDPSSRHGSDWIEITIRSDPCTHEAVSHFALESLGCDGVVTDASSERTLRAYLPAEPPPESIGPRVEAFLAGLSEWFPGIDAPSFGLDRVRQPDWRTAWREHFRAEQVTPGLLVVPAWEPVPRDVAGRLLRMDPGPAFGTGRHATTRMCLQALEDLVPEVPWSLLDVGTGSGILAAYGVLLGASPVEGVDVDEEALRWAAWNLELNGLSGAVRLSSDPLDSWKAPFSVVTANLTLDTIQRLLPQLSRLVSPGGSLVISGLLREQVSPLGTALAREGLGAVRELRQEEWACLVLERSGTGWAGKERP